MAFEWDDDKHRSNLAKHGVDFVDVQVLFDGRPLFTERNRRFGEERSVSTGIIDDRFYTVVWTERGNDIRVIYARRARHGEQRAYRAVYRG